jgi:hypothetical protein
VGSTTLWLLAGSSSGGTKGTVIVKLPYSSVTPKEVYFSRRRFLAGASAALGFASGISFANTKLNAVKSPFSTTEKPTPYQDVTSYNNFYEFGTGKGDPVHNAKNFRTTPWTVSIEGAVAKPQVLDLDALLKVAPLEERIYRHRCVEAWSIVVPWIGFPLSALIKLPTFEIHARNPLSYRVLGCALLSSPELSTKIPRPGIVQCHHIRSRHR